MKDFLMVAAGTCFRHAGKTKTKTKDHQRKNHTINEHYEQIETLKISLWVIFLTLFVLPPDGMGANYMGLPVMLISDLHFTYFLQ